MGRPIKKGSTDQSTIIRILDSTTFLPETAVEHDTAGIDLWYRREQSTKISIVEVALAALDSAHSDGGIEHIGDGYYRLDLPDAAVAAGSGKNSVQVGGTVTGMIVIGNEHTLVDYDPYDAVRAGLTALPNAAADAAGGLPISDAGGLDMDNLKSELDGLQGTDGKCLVSTDAQDLSGTLDVNTKTITAGIIANASFNADVGSTAYATNIIALAVRKVLDELNLDHLCKVATAGADMTTEITDNAILSRILANGDTSAFVPSTDSLQAIRDKETDIETDTAEIGAAGAGLTDLGGMSNGMKAEVNAEVDTALTDYDPPTKTEMDTGHGLLATEAKQDVIDGIIDAILVDTDTTIPALIAALNNLSAADVNAQVLDVLQTDTFAEPSSIPAATASLKDKIGFLAALARNKITQSSSVLTLRNDADDANIGTAPISRTSSLFTRGEFS